MNTKSICLKVGVAVLVAASVSVAQAQPQGGPGAAWACSAAWVATPRS